MFYPQIDNLAIVNDIFESRTKIRNEQINKEPKIKAYLFKLEQLKKVKIIGIERR